MTMYICFFLFPDAFQMYETLSILYFLVFKNLNVPECLNMIFIFKVMVTQGFKE